MFGMAKAGSKKSATSNQPSSTRIYKARILKVKSPASEGKFDASGASTFRVTGDHFWIAVTHTLQKQCQYVKLFIQISWCHFGFKANKG